MRRAIAFLLILAGIVTLSLQIIASKRNLKEAINTNAQRILEIAVDKLVQQQHANPLLQRITPEQPWFDAYARNQFRALISPKIDVKDFLNRLKDELKSQAIEDAELSAMIDEATGLADRLRSFSPPAPRIVPSKEHKKLMKKWAKQLREYDLWPDDARWIDSMAELATELDEVRAEAERISAAVVEHKRDEANLELLLLEILARAKELTSTPDEIWSWDEITADPNKVFELVEPNLPFFPELERLYSRYLELKDVKFEPIRLRVKLRKGMTHPAVAKIKERLALENFFYGDTTSRFDDAFEDAVKSFQKFHGLNPDGVIGKRTLAALNMPFERKLEIVELNLERARKSPARKYDTFIWINVPSFGLWLIRGGEVLFSSKVVVGNRRWLLWAPPWLDELPRNIRPKPVRGPWNQTPVLESALDKIVINPRWGTSERILEELLAEKEKKQDESEPEDTLRFDRSNYIWGLHPSGRVYLYQDPSVANLLGKVKFSFPNEHAIFLHDTPAKYLFKRWPRDFSHGCIRVEKPLELARLILEIDANEALDELDELLEDSSKPHIIQLNEPLPLVIDYMTVGPTDWTDVAFLQDIYLLDPPEAERLEKKREKFQIYLKELERIRKGRIWPKRY